METNMVKLCKNHGYPMEQYGTYTHIIGIIVGIIMIKPTLNWIINRNIIEIVIGNKWDNHG